MGPWILILFNGLQFVSLIIYFDAEIANLVMESPTMWLLFFWKCFSTFFGGFFTAWNNQMFQAHLVLFKAWTQPSLRSRRDQDTFK